MWRRRRRTRRERWAERRGLRRRRRRRDGRARPAEVRSRHRGRAARCAGRGTSRGRRRKPEARRRSQRPTGPGSRTPSEAPCGRWSGQVIARSTRFGALDRNNGEWRRSRIRRRKQGIRDEVGVESRRTYVG